MLFVTSLLLFSGFCTCKQSFFIADLERLIGENDCIEAFLASITPDDQSTIVLEKVSHVAKEGSHQVSPNLTDIVGKTQFEKSLTTKINELAQYNNIIATYELISEEGLPHRRNFRVLLKLGVETYEGEGTSLKKAKQFAAGSALQYTSYSHHPNQLEETRTQILTPTVILNNVATKLGISISYYLDHGRESKEISNYDDSNVAYGKPKKSYLQKLNHSIYHQDAAKVPLEDPQISGPFTVRVKVGENDFIGVGHTIQSARHHAATKALDFMKRQSLNKDNVCANEESTDLCREKRDSLKSPISRIYEAAQVHNLVMEFKVVQETGPAHKKFFVTECRLGDFVTEGEGKSKKESKQVAAEKMLENLLMLPKIEDGREIINGLKQKKKKKKKNSVIRNNVQNGFNDVISYVWPTKESNTLQSKSSHQSSSTPKSLSFQGRLLEISNLLNIEAQFLDLNKRDETFFTLLSLGTHPPHICLGKAATKDDSVNDAASHGLKFFHKLGLMDQFRLRRNDEEGNGLDEEMFEDVGVYVDIEKKSKN